ncbi:MAG: DUF2470 domain-containing protein [Alphaproteobacteria bacterium]
MPANDGGPKTDSGPNADAGPATDIGRQARLLVRRGPEAALGSLIGGAGAGAAAPYVSLVGVASDYDGSPLLLISDLAEHTKNIKADPRVSLLFASPMEEGGNPLARARLTVLGRAEVTGEAGHRARFLARHPEASFYAGFADFRFYRVAVERAHLVAGFGKIHWIERPRLLAPSADAIAAIAADVIEHMNADHGDAVRNYAERLAQAPSGAGGEWRMAAIDPDGCDLVAGGASVRVDFAAPVTDAASARAELVRLAELARTAT